MRLSTACHDHTFITGDQICPQLIKPRRNTHLCALYPKITCRKYVIVRMCDMCTRKATEGMGLMARLAG